MTLIGACGGVYARLSVLVDRLTAETRERLAPVCAIADAAELQGDR